MAADLDDDAGDTTMSCGLNATTSGVDKMGTEIEVIEERLKSFLEHLSLECGIFERMVYKNKNQHRRCSYFQYLLKVRRDLRLLQSAKLQDILASCFHVITGDKPKQKLHLLESLKLRKHGRGVPNFLERLLGAARLLSQMVEPMLKAACEVSTLLARSFFMGFSLTVLALLARLRVLVQQILLDVVSVFNTVSSLSQKKQSIKITHEGLEVFREYFPTNKESITLECLWQTDKFSLCETIHESEVKTQDVDIGDTSTERSALQYKSINFFLGDESDSEHSNADNTAVEASLAMEEDKMDLLADPSSKIVNDSEVGAGNDKLLPENCQPETSSPSSEFLTVKSDAIVGPTAVVSVKRPASSTPAFVSVKRPATSKSNVTDHHSDKTKKEGIDEQDSFFNLLTGGSLKNSLF